MNDRAFGMDIICNFMSIIHHPSGPSHRQSMRAKFNIRGTTDCACCGCFSFLCDGDAEKIDDFCTYLYCFSCAVCQETRHMRRYNCGSIAARYRQGLKLVHFSPQRKHLSWHTLGGSVTKTAQAELRSGRV